MKYPKHIILDLRTPEHLIINETWDLKYQRLNSLNLDFKTVEFSSSVKPMRKIINRSNNSSNLNSTTFSLFDINFLRKEKIYTKLKYSRCPQYDIVSGGFAAIFAGFIGFLISEKFGIELVDSGDFYIAFMYCVFAVFAVRPLIRIYSKDSAQYTPLSLKYSFIFFKDLLILFVAELKLIYSKVKFW